MRGLTIRWSLVGAGPEVAAELARFVHEVSYTRFAQLPGLEFKLWRMHPGQWFEGTYVFATATARAEFERQFAETAAQAPGTEIIGSLPILIESWQPVALVAGPEGFRPFSR